MSDTLTTLSKGLAVFLLIVGIALLGMAIGFGLSPPVMANYMACDPYGISGCTKAAAKINNFAMYSFIGGLVVSACGGVGLAGLSREEQDE